MPSIFQTIRKRLQEGPATTHWLAWDALPLFTRIKTLGRWVAHGQGTSPRPAPGRESSLSPQARGPFHP